jgi:transposase
VRTGRTATGRASRTRWMRSARRGPRSPAEPRARPGGRDGAVEAVRALMVAKRSARAERTQAINQARALLVTGPDELRARFARHAPAQLVAELAALRPRPGDVPGYATRVALRELGRRARFPGAQIAVWVSSSSRWWLPGPRACWACTASGPDTATLLLIAAGDHPQRLRSEAAWAHLCGAAPIPASSGKVTRWRLNRGGDREASHALWRIVITRMSSHPATRAYVDRRGKEGLTEKEIIRCLKRYVARQVYPYLRPAR